MDVTLSILTGLGLRIFLARIEEPLGKLSPALLGLWEGAVVHQLSSKSSESSLDHYLAFGLRVSIDLLVTGNLKRMIIVILWAALGAVLSEALTPTPAPVHRSSKRERRSKHAQSLPSHVRVYKPPTPQPIIQQTPPHPPPEQLLQPPAFTSTPPHPPPEQLLQPLAITSTPPHLPQLSPHFRPSRPPSPPSFFLQGDESLNISPSPTPIRLTLAPNPIQSTPPLRPPSALASFLEESSETGSPLPKPMLLPTPPESTDVKPDSLSGDDQVDRRLYTIQEQSSGEEQTPPSQSDLDEPTLEYVDEPVYEPSITNTAIPIPIPVPDPSSRVTTRNAAEGDMGGNMYVGSIVSSSAPLPIPNPFPQSLFDPQTPSEADELLTPGQPERPELMNETDVDELRTPLALASVLSPLDFEEGHAFFPGPDAAEPEPTSKEAPGPEMQQFEVVPDLHIISPIGNKFSLSPNMTIIPDIPPPETVSETAPLAPSLAPPSPSILTDSDALSAVSLVPSSKLYAKAELLRKQARDEEAEYLRLKKELDIAMNQKRAKDALGLRVDIRDSELKAKKLHQQAAKYYYESLNKTQKPSTVDVHGLRVDEAIHRTEKAFREALAAGQSKLKVIVGKGIHSQGPPVLKPKLLNHMQKNHIPCVVDGRNAGLLILSLPPS